MPKPHDHGHHSTQQQRGNVELGLSTENRYIEEYAVLHPKPEAHCRFMAGVSASTSRSYARKKTEGHAITRNLSPVEDAHDTDP
ncbi:hypothetical protein ON010_g1204 [Phytophthora cinnamomi]|nr:hypothetical protein ON010_g1204 [Phytophthora cinnamomi]